MAIKKIRLPDGTDAVIDEWLHWPLFSRVEWAAASGVDLRAYTYVRGQRVPRTGLVARVADERDTNMVARTRINHDEAFIGYSLTYEVFALSTAEVDSPALPTAPLPMLLSTNHRRLDRDLLVELFVGAGIRKPQFRAPFAYIGQSVGSPAWASGDTVDAVVTPRLSYGTGGAICPRNQRRWALPIYIESDRVMYLRTWAPDGAVGGLTQDISLRWWLDGLKRRPVA